MRSYHSYQTISSVGVNLTSDSHRDLEARDDNVFSQCSHFFGEDLTQASNVILYLAKVKLVLTWFAVTQ